MHECSSPSPVERLAIGKEDIDYDGKCHVFLRNRGVNKFRINDPVQQTTGDLYLYPTYKGHCCSGYEPIKSFPDI